VCRVSGDVIYIKEDSRVSGGYQNRADEEMAIINVQLNHSNDDPMRVCV